MENSIISIIGKGEQTIYMEKNTSLLLNLEINNIKIDYQCRSGYCGMCRVKLIKGSILYSIKQPMAALFEKKEIFPCCCQPDGNITIEI